MNYYEILEINENASDEVIKMAYKALVLKYHPDTYKGDKKYAEEMTKKINVAYDTLSDKDKKMEYDKKIKDEKDTNFTNGQEYEVNNNKENATYNKNSKENMTNTINNDNYVLKFSMKNILLYISLFFIFIICLCLIISTSTNDTSNQSLPKEYSTTQSYGKINSIIEVDNIKFSTGVNITSGYIYKINNDEYWYSPFGEKLTGNISILTNGNYDYIIKENKQNVYKVEIACESKIKNDFVGFSSGNTYLLENGQVWTQESTCTYSKRIKNPKVTIFHITNNSYNGYYLCVDDINKAVKLE